jgi:hypothetical protein
MTGKNNMDTETDCPLHHNGQPIFVLQQQKYERCSIMTQKQSQTARNNSLNHRVYLARREAMKKEMRKLEIKEAKKAALVDNINLRQLFQSKPRKLETYNQHKNRSFTNSLESYQNGANKERLILQRNNRIPTKEIIINFLLVFSATGIKVIRKWLFHHLRKDGIEAITNIELTRSKPRNGKPNNRVHIHILTDDSRSKEELRAIVISACERCALVNKKFVQITIKEIENGNRYFEYFTKYDREAKAEIEAIREAKAKMKEEGKDWEDWDENTDNDPDKSRGWKTVILFQKHTGLDKFMPIGKWFRKPKEEIWEEIRAFMKAEYAQ